MGSSMVRYKVRPDRADENVALVEAVYAQLARERPDGIHYATFRLPDGFSWDEMKVILSHAVANPRAVGLEVTIYNPALDPDGAAGRGLTDALVASLA